MAVRVVFLSLALIPCLILLGFSVHNIYRQAFFTNGKSGKLKYFYHLRFAIVICCFLQLICFIGYLIDSVGLHQFAWNVWIPLALSCLTILSIRLSESYINIRSLHFTINQKHVYIAYTSWAIASLFNWIGSICGWAFNARVAQAFFYATWKVLASVCLSVVCWIIWQVREASKAAYEQQIHRQSLDIRFKPRESNLSGDFADTVKALKLSAKNSLNESIEKIRRHSKNGSTELNMDASPAEKNAFNVAEDKGVPPVLSDEEDGDGNFEDVQIMNTPQQSLRSNKTTMGDTENELVRQSTHDRVNVDELTAKEKQIFKMNHSLNRMRNLLFGLIILVFVLMMDAIIQYVHFGELAANPKNVDKYSRPSIAQVVLVYLSIWSFVQCILLIYTWIPGKEFKLQVERKRTEADEKVNSKSDTSTTKTAESSATVPM